MFCSKKKKHAKIWAEAFKLKEAYRNLSYYEKIYMFAYNRNCREFYNCVSYYHPLYEQYRKLKFRPK